MSSVDIEVVHMQPLIMSSKDSGAGMYAQCSMTWDCVNVDHLLHLRLLLLIIVLFFFLCVSPPRAQQRLQARPDAAQCLRP